MYDRNTIFYECLDAIKENELCFFDDLSMHVAPTLKTLYDWKFHECEDIKSELAKNKIKAKFRMKKNWQNPDAAPALQISVFKLMADDDEYNRLTTSKNELKGEIKGGMIININPLEGCEPIE